MHARTILILFLTLLLTATLANAANYQLDVTPIHNTIYPNESAEYKLVITNFDDTGQRFQLYTYDTKWVLRVDPTLSLVQPEEQREYTVWVKPKQDIGYGTQGTNILIKNLETKQIHQEDLIIHVQDPNRAPGTYAASVEVRTHYETPADPREDFTLTIDLRNRNALNLPDLNVSIQSPLFEKTTTLNLEGLAERSEAYTFHLNPHQKAGEYPLRVLLTRDGQVVNDATRTITIGEYREVDETVRDESSLFKAETVLTVENTGNALTAYDATLPTNFFRKLFTSTNPKTTTAIVGGERVHVWHLEVAPGERVTLTRTENYRLLILVLVLVIAGVILYYVLRSPLLAVKETIALDESGEGTSHLKVRLFIKNRTGKQLEGVYVVDKVPSIASYKAAEHLGTVSPTKVVRSPKKGTVLKWELDFLEPYEERILSYSLASSLQIIGKMKLPSAKVHFSAKNGKERVTYTKNVAHQE